VNTEPHDSWTAGYPGRCDLCQKETPIEDISPGVSCGWRVGYVCKVCGDSHKPPFSFDLTPPTHLPKLPDPATYLREKSNQILTDLYRTNPRPPASSLTDEQKWAILFRHGLMRYDFHTKTFVSTHPVGIADDGNGGYIVGHDPSRPQP
jgi:hypothetical protein